MHRIAGRDAPVRSSRLACRTQGAAPAGHAHRPADDRRRRGGHARVAAGAGAAARSAGWPSALSRPPTPTAGCASPSAAPPWPGKDLRAGVASPIDIRLSGVVCARPTARRSPKCRAPNWRSRRRAGGGTHHSAHARARRAPPRGRTLGGRHDPRRARRGGRRRHERARPAAAAARRTGAAAPGGPRGAARRARAVATAEDPRRHASRWRPPAWRDLAGDGVELDLVRDRPAAPRRTGG